MGNQSILFDIAHMVHSFLMDDQCILLCIALNQHNPAINIHAYLLTNQQGQFNLIVPVKPVFAQAWNATLSKIWDKN